MSASISCDNCGLTSAVDDVESTFWWQQLGWMDGPMAHACSGDCAHALVDNMTAQQQKAEAEADAADSTASDGT